jgi:hypothetical protein
MQQPQSDYADDRPDWLTRHDDWGEMACLKRDVDTAQCFPAHAAAAGTQTTAPQRTL